MGPLISGKSRLVKDYNNLAGMLAKNPSLTGPFLVESGGQLEPFVQLAEGCYTPGSSNT